MIKITIVAGARHDFVKIASLIHEIQNRKSEGWKLDFRLVHTGQHYDQKKSGDFFDQLNIPLPDVNLGGGGGTQAEQTASIMVAFEKELLDNSPDLVVSGR